MIVFIGKLLFVSKKRSFAAGEAYATFIEPFMGAHTQELKGKSKI